MNEENKRLLVAGIAGALGGALGAVCGSSSLFVVMCVSLGGAVLIAWGINGMFN
ncbi:hypothetical protein KAI32_00965 [Candidatus Pacearchaeota archaeon]|nr:hypothetical protein [Candidatus Pacearchaeota archaeon]